VTVVDCCLALRLRSFVVVLRTFVVRCYLPDSVVVVTLLDLDVVAICRTILTLLTLGFVDVVTICYYLLVRQCLRVVLPRCYVLICR